jgi:hypothetical protein
MRHDDAACSKSTELWAVLVDFLPQCWRDYLSRVIFLAARADPMQQGLRTMK